MGMLMNSLLQVLQSFLATAYSQKAYLHITIKSVKLTQNAALWPNEIQPFKIFPPSAAFTILKCFYLKAAFSQYHKWTFISII